MGMHGLLRKVCWYLFLVILTGAVVVWARGPRPVAQAPHSSAALTGGIVLQERNFNLGSTSLGSVDILPNTAFRDAGTKGSTEVLHGNPAPR